MNTHTYMHKRIRKNVYILKIVSWAGNVTHVKNTIVLISLVYISPLWHLTLYRMLLYFMPQQLVVQVTRNTGLIDGKHFHGILHPIKRCALPHKLNREVVSTVDGYANIALQLQSNFFTET